MNMMKLQAPFNRQLRAFRMLGLRLSAPVRPAVRKVFGLGLSRTGTKSLHRALLDLGYRSDHFSTHLLKAGGDGLALDMEKVRLFDALTDITCSLFFRELDLRFPGSKFVLTVRDMEGWISSCKRHFPPLVAGKWPSDSTRVLKLREMAYGGREFDAERYRAAYARHQEDVLAHFEGRPQDLLVIDICAGDGWEKLCAFLGKPVPTSRFPWANRVSGGR